MRRKVTRLFRDNPDEYYLPNESAFSTRHVNNDISRGNEENVKRLRGLFVDFQKKRAQDGANVNLVHDQFMDFTCDKCGESFHNIMAMKTHRIIKHIVQKVYECDICCKQFAFKESLNVHKDKRSCIKEPEEKQPQEIKVSFMLDFSSIKVQSSPPPPVNPSSSSSLKCTDCGTPFAKKALLVWHRRHVCK